MKKLLFFTLSFAALTALLTGFWNVWGWKLYMKFMTPIAQEVYGWVGLSGVGTMARMRFINFVPFIALMLLTPRLGLRKRFVGLGLGLILLSISHLLLNGIAVATETARGLPLYGMLICDAMPFLIWFLFAQEFVRGILQGARNSHGESIVDIDRTFDED